MFNKHKNHESHRHKFEWYVLTGQTLNTDFKSSKLKKPCHCRFNFDSSKLKNSNWSLTPINTN